MGFGVESGVEILGFGLGMIEVCGGYDYDFVCLVVFYRGVF